MADTPASESWRCCRSERSRGPTASSTGSWSILLLLIQQRNLSTGAAPPMVGLMNESNDVNESYDVVVIGGGAAGLSSSRRWPGRAVRSSWLTRASRATARRTTCTTSSPATARRRRSLSRRPHRGRPVRRARQGRPCHLAEPGRRALAGRGQRRAGYRAAAARRDRAAR